EVWDEHQGRVALGLDALDLALQPGDLLAQPFALRDQLLLAGRVLLLGNALGHLVGPLLERLRLLDEPAALVVEPDDARGVGRRHVGVGEMGDEGMGVVWDVRGVEHDNPRVTGPASGGERGRVSAPSDVKVSIYLPVLGALTRPRSPRNSRSSLHPLLQR